MVSSEAPCSQQFGSWLDAGPCHLPPLRFVLLNRLRGFLQVEIYTAVSDRFRGLLFLGKPGFKARDAQHILAQGATQRWSGKGLTNSKVLKYPASGHGRPQIVRAFQDWRHDRDAPKWCVDRGGGVYWREAVNVENDSMATELGISHRPDAMNLCAHLHLHPNRNRRQLC